MRTIRHFGCKSPAATALLVAAALLAAVADGAEEFAAAPRTARRRRRTQTASVTAAGKMDELSPEIDLDAPDAPPGVLMLPGKKFPLDYAGGELRVHDVPLLVREVPNTGAGTGLNIWDGAAVLTKYLEHSGLDLSDKRVLEVGAGTGLVGIAASVLGAGCVLLTDLEYTLMNTAANVAANEPSLRGRVHTAELDWFRPGTAGASVAALAQRPHYILGADVVWVDSLIEPLVRTLAWATQPAAPLAAVPAAGSGGIADAGAAASRVGTEFDAAAVVVASVTAPAAAAAAGGGGSLFSSHGPPPPVAGSCGGAAVEGKLPSPAVWRDGRKVEAAVAVAATVAAASGSSSTAGAGAESAGSGTAAVVEPQTVILLAHQTRARSSDALLFRLLDEHGFEWAPLPHSDMHPRFRDADINIFRIVRRA